jgi:hypothetical protein
MEEPFKRQTRFNRTAWRRGLEELDPAARAAMAAVAAEKERHSDLDIDRMVAGLGATAEAEDDSR